MHSKMLFVLFLKLGSPTSLGLQLLHKAVYTSAHKKNPAVYFLPKGNLTDSFKLNDIDTVKKDALAILAWVNDKNPGYIRASRKSSSCKSLCQEH